MYLLRRISILLLLTGCASHVSTRLDPYRMPDNWRWESVQIPPPQVEEWWYIYNDPVLNDLEAQALSANPTLYEAFFKVEEIRANYIHSIADLAPNITLEPSVTQQGYLQQNLIPIPNVAIPPFFRIHQQTYEVPLNFTYELDVFGRLQYAAQADYASYEAQKAAYNVTRLALTTDVATAYFNLKADLRKINILKDTIKVRQEAYEVNLARYEAGQVNYTDVSQADLERQRALVDLMKIEEDKAQQENLLLRLTSLNVLPIYDQLIDKPPTVPAGIPSELLLRRPNLIEAQYTILSNSKRIAQSKAALFPSFNLTAMYGYNSPNIKKLFSWFSHFWYWQVAVSQTLIDFGRKESDIDLAKSRYMQAVANYAELVLEAIQEAENALATIQLVDKELVYIKNSIDAAEISTNLFKERYLRGLVNYLEVVTSERALLLAQQDEVDGLLREHLATINLVKAIGGSFDSAYAPYIDPDEVEYTPDCPQKIIETTAGEYSSEEYIHN